jgi:hypothetical protein
MIGKIYEWYCIKLKIFSQKNKQLPKWRDSPQNGRKSLLPIHWIMNQIRNI